MTVSREILKYEFKKINTSPIVVVLFTLFLVFDLLMVFNGNRDREDLSVINKIVDNVGYNINDEMMEKFKVYYNKNLKEAMNIIETKEGKSYKSVSEYIDEVGNYYLKEKYSYDQVKIIKDTASIENYYTEIPALIKRYDELSISAMADSLIKGTKLSGSAEKLARQNFAKFNDRFSEVKENKEYMQLFFDSSKFIMHEFLYKDILRTIILQMMVLIGLLVPSLVNYEFDSGTSLLIYSSKRGRRLINDKLKVVVSVVLILSTVLLGIVLLTFFYLYDYSRMWNVSINSLFNWEKFIPYISWFRLTVKQYLILMILLTYSCLLIFTAMAFVIGILIKNSYVGSALFAILNSLGFFMPHLISGSSVLKIYSAFNPSSLIFNFRYRFIQSEALTCFKYYELITVVVWAVLMAVAMWYSIKRFRRTSIS
ncbi:hypothetical protein [Clostridium manihotivorum]|uniref:ABC-2 family transporter protein n=1 Tax=Clostridium manihotivorum TaxID=2320868 RepID=A0A410DV90_9CLOT|nr:hypothetical protein [Clostridium manihotivorum]QAA33001.1 hypothetical protein C1I91_15885 [Clostridium manihotivorum]